MPRLTEAERQKLMSDYNGHYSEVLLIDPTFEIEPGFGLVQLRALEATYNDKVAAIDAIDQTGMPAKRAQRDALFGLSFEDTDGVWAWLKLYKNTVNLVLRNLPAARSLKTTVPNLGAISPGAYDAILSRFAEHWTLVNAALPAASPLVLGQLTLAGLNARRAQIKDLEGQIDETVLTRLAVMRAEREEIFGDVTQEERAPDSVIGRLEAYANKVQLTFLGQPLANTLPPIFPDAGSAGLPEFPFNWKQVGSDVTVWFEMPEAVEAAVIYLKEGAFEETLSVPVTPPLQVTFSGVAIQGDVDDVELRDDAGKTVAHGKFDSALIEPI